MKLHLNDRPDCLLIHSCVLHHDRHRIRIAGTAYEQSLILTPQAVELWDVNDVSALTAEHFQHLANLGAEVVILGTGAHTTFPPPPLTRPLIQNRIGLEPMPTPAACRTYNILASDGRKAVAALIV